MKQFNYLVIFDCDGTLVDSQHSIVAAMTAAWRGIGLADPDPAAVRRVVGLSLVDAIAALLPEASCERHLALAEDYKHAFLMQRQAGTTHEPLFPGIRETLHALDRAGILMGIATGKSHRGLTSTLATHDLAGLFVTLQTADHAPGKPDPGMVEQALAESGAERERTLVVGDTVYDVEMARRAGVPAIGVAWGYHSPRELAAAGARCVVRDADELTPVILDLLAERA